DNVAKNTLGMIIRKIDCGIDLEIRGDVPGYAYCGRVFRSTQEIELQSPLLVEIVSVAENRLILIRGMNGTKDRFVVLGVIAAFDERLGVNMAVWRPVDEADGEKARLFS